MPFIIGWGILRLETNPDYSNEIQSYAAGFLEGILTEFDIFVISTNIYTDKEPTDLVDIVFSNSFITHMLMVQIKGLLEENAEWEKKESEASPDKRYWNHRKYLDLQMDGIYDGYMFINKDKPERVSVIPFNSFHVISISASGKFSTRTTTAMWMIGLPFITRLPLLLMLSTTLIIALP